MSWERLGVIEASALSSARATAHWAAQIVAAVGETHAAHAPDTSHTAMTYHPEWGGFLGVPCSEDGLRAALWIPDLSVGLLRHNEVLVHLHLDGWTLAEASDWMERAIARHSRGQIDAPLRFPQYELPAHGIFEGASFVHEARPLRELDRWFSNAQAALTRQSRGEDEAILCWPHHFDIAMLRTLARSASGDAARTIGIGLSPGDEAIAEPYWYVNHWPATDPARASFGALPARRWSIWREEKARRRHDDRGRGLNSAVLFDALTRLVASDAILPVDVGNNTYSFGRYFECDGQAVLMSGYLGSIGFAFPAALGAWCATQEPDTPFAGRSVVSISGDGGFGQYPFELTTAVKYGMNVTHVLLHNGELGKISKEQRGGQWPVWETSLHNPGFAAFAEQCGAKGVRIDAADELDAGIGEALAHPGPALIEVICDAELV